MIFVPPVVDIERLHQVIEQLRSGGFRGKGEGKTFAYLHLMANEVELGDGHNNYMYVGENARLTNWVAHEFVAYVSNMFGDNTISMQTSTSACTSNGQIYQFVGADTVEKCGCGRTINRLFLDVSTDTRTRMASGKNHMFYQTILPMLLSRGDII